MVLPFHLLRPICHFLLGYWIPNAHLGKKKNAYNENSVDYTPVKVGVAMTPNLGVAMTPNAINAELAGYLPYRIINHFIHIQNISFTVMN